MPIHAEIPLRYLQGLKAYTDAKVKRAKNADAFSDENARATLQSQWVDGLIRQVKKVEGTQGELVKLHPPHLTETGGPAPGLHRSVMLQGPVIFSPGPQEVGAAEDEDAASDLVMIKDMLAIAWSGGRVDLAVRRRVDPRWLSSRVSVVASLSSAVCIRRRLTIRIPNRSYQAYLSSNLYCYLFPTFPNSMLPHFSPTCCTKTLYTSPILSGSMQSA